MIANRPGSGGVTARLTESWRRPSANAVTLSVADDWR